MPGGLVHSSKTEDGRACFWWWCPGCDFPHRIESVLRSGKPGWEVSGLPDKPTFAPSVKCTGALLCHCHVTAGQIQFLSDCTHALKGQTVPMVPHEFGPGYDP